MSKLLISDVREGGQDKYGNNRFYLDGKTEDGQEFVDAYLAQKSDKPPEKGILDGYFATEGEQGWRVKREQQQSFAGGRGRSPQDDERIARAVALKAAVDMAPEGVTSQDVVTVAKTFLPFLRGDD